MSGQLISKSFILFFVLLSPIIGHSQTATDCATTYAKEKSDNSARSKERVENGLYMCSEQFGNDGERFGDNTRREELKAASDETRINYDNCILEKGILSAECQDLSKISYDAYKLFVDNSGGYGDCEIAAREDARKLLAAEDRAADDNLRSCLKNSTRFNNLVPLTLSTVTK